MKVLVVAVVVKGSAGVRAVVFYRVVRGLEDVAGEGTRKAFVRRNDDEQKFSVFLLLVGNEFVARHNERVLVFLPAHLAHNAAHDLFSFGNVGKIAEQCVACGIETRTGDHVHCVGYLLNVLDGFNPAANVL